MGRDSFKESRNRHELKGLLVGKIFEMSVRASSMRENQKGERDTVEVRGGGGLRANRAMSLMSL